ncbi:MAG TPA: DEAD/DEAH box helicase [Polyangiaceae bacterium]
MIDFKKYGGKTRVVDVADPLKLFESLDVKTSHTTLRPAQIEAIQLLAARRSERDHVLKMNTGAGKTTAALLYLRSHAAEKHRPVVYLCPTIQLVDQVLEEADKLGILAVHYRAGEPHPDPKGMSGEAVIVCAYEKLFNARTTFDRVDVGLSPCALVLDDAHAGIERIRDAFTIRLDGGSMRERIAGLLAPALKAYMPGLWKDVERGDPAAVMEVPYWIWRPLADEIRNALAEEADGELKFVWGYLRDQLEWCRCLVSGASVEILPDPPPVEQVRAYHDAPHRLFTSATLADDSSLVRELGCSSAAALAPIVPGSDQGVGERMVLAPSLIHKNLDRPWVMAWCAVLAKRVNVVVLAASGAAAAEWSAHGATVVLGEDVRETVRALRAGRERFVVFANRYDGLDLPDDACRVIVLDGMPFGEGASSRYDSSIPGRPGAAHNRLVHRIEQGMGRAVRSHADYAVVILAGPELAHFVARLDILELFNASTRAQIEFAHDLTEIALHEKPGAPEQAVSDLAWSCLTRAEGWKDLYDDKVRTIAKGTTEPSKAAIALAHAEREAIHFALTREPSRAADSIEGALTQHAGNDKQKGWYLQVAARYRFAVDQGRALQTQIAAYAKNERMLAPPTGTVMRPERGDRADAATAVLRWYAGFSNVNGVLAAFQGVRARLGFEVSADAMEQGLADLAVFIGGEGSRPEHDQGRGPDDLWLFHDASFVIEAKNEAVYPRLPKKDSGQLHDSLQWFRDSYPSRVAVSIIVARPTEAEHDAHFPEGTRVLTPQGLASLLGNVEGFLADLVKRPAAQWTAKEVGQLISRWKLSASRVVGSYTEPVR